MGLWAERGPRPACRPSRRGGSRPSRRMGRGPDRAPCDEVTAGRGDQCLDDATVASSLRSVPAPPTACAGVRVRCGVGSADHRGEEPDESRRLGASCRPQHAHVGQPSISTYASAASLGRSRANPEQRRLHAPACRRVRAASTPRTSSASTAGVAAAPEVHGPCGGKADASADPRAARASPAPISPTGSAASAGAVRELADWPGEHRAGG
jgi:hypothetical protein